MTFHARKPAGRHRFATVSAVVAAISAATVLIGTDAVARTLRVAYLVNPSHVYAAEGIVPFTEEITRRTDGAITFTHFPSQQLGKAADSVRMLQSKIADMTFISVAFHAQELPATQALNLPWGWDTWTAANVGWRAVHEPGVIHSELERAGVVPLFLSAQPPYEFHTTDKPLPGLDSLAGLKIRSPGGVFGEIIRAVGANPVEVKTPDQYEALQRGLLDGTIYAFSSWRSTNVNELLNHTTLGVNVSVPNGIFLAMAAGTMASLPPEHQAIFREVSHAFSNRVQAKVLENNEADLKTYVDGGLQTYVWSEADIARMNDALAPVVDNSAKQASEAGLDGPLVIEQLRAFAVEARKAPRDKPAYHAKTQ